ncbi:glycine-rich domain-containing protein [Roseobacteraceae bacterium S113]
MQDIALWQRIEAHRLDASGASWPFSHKLAQAEGWTASHTDAVIVEYRRFLYLSVISEGETTPSEDIDRAWHMHLTFTRNYWDELMPKLPRPLHHEPCRSEEDLPRYGAQYEATRDLYEQEFGVKPPRAIWPGPGARRVRHWSQMARRGALVPMVAGVMAFWGQLFELGGLLVAIGCAIFVASLVVDMIYAPSGRKAPEDAGAGCGGGSCGGD